MRLLIYVVSSMIGEPSLGVAGVTNVVTGGRGLSLADAKQMAFERNWDLLAAKSGLDAATAQLIVAKEFPNPSLAWSTARIGTHDSSTPMGNGIYSRNYDTIVQVNQLIEIGGKRHARQMAGRAGVAGAKARFLDAKRTLDQGVTKAYVAALLAGENARVFHESSGFLHHEADIAQARLRAGDLSDSDEKQIEIGAEQYELQARAADATAVQARVAVEILLGEGEPNGQWTPTDSLDQLVANQGIVETNSVGVRPDIAAAAQDLRGSQAQLKLQKAERIPDPTFSIGIEHNPPGGGTGIGPDVNTVIAGVSFPLPLWNFNGGNIKAAQTTVDQSQIALDKARAQAVADIANAQVSYREASERWNMYREVTGPKSGKIRESLEFAYRKGGTSLVDFLEAERTDNDVRLATAQAMADTASTAADLLAAETTSTERELTSVK
ncbi:MAG TPA: TolC family protein [Verrucomicrobiae bacterium]|jgi:cobalt-zinc-cadmium efflux system outer membrane protein|nr:TolC family protein [Verrucomicrobiae bacterium]